MPWTTTAPLASGGWPEGMVPSAPPPQGNKSSPAFLGEEGRTSSPPPVEGEVLEVTVQKKKFKVIEPTIPDLPGEKTTPYPTSDVRRAMGQPSATLQNVNGQLVYRFYGYFWNKPENEEKWFQGEGVGKSEQPPGAHKYISLRESPAECLDRSTWGSFA